jgi:hypothetical protein
MTEADRENIAYSRSFMNSMHKNTLEKDLNRDLENKILNADQINYHREAAKRLNNSGLIKMMDAKAARRNKPPKPTYRAPAPRDGPPAIRRRSRRSASRSRSRSPVLRRSRSRSPARRRHSGPVPRLNLDATPSPSRGGKTFKKRMRRKHKHTKRR